jgi:hypothetical protein
MKRLVLCCAVWFLHVTSAFAVPAAPTNLTASVSGSSVFFTWTAPATPVLGYRLDAGFTPGGTLASTVFEPATSFLAFPIAPGTYYFRLVAGDLTGISAPSNEVIVVVGGGGGGTCTAAPAAPLGLAATVAGSSVSVGWAGGGGCPATNYTLHAGSGPGLSNVAVASLGTATTLSAVAPAGTYYVRVFAQNAFGTSGPSNEIVVVIGGAAPPPSSPPGANADLVFNEAANLLNSGRLLEARARFVTVTSLDPTRADTYYGIGYIDLILGNVPGVIDAFRRYLSLAPTGTYAAVVSATLAQLGG